MDGWRDWWWMDGCCYRNAQRFRGGFAFKADRLLYHSTLGSRVIKKKKKGRVIAVWLDDWWTDSCWHDAWISMYGRTDWWMFVAGWMGYYFMDGIHQPSEFLHSEPSLYAFSWKSDAISSTKILFFLGVGANHLFESPQFVGIRWPHVKIKGVQASDFTWKENWTKARMSECEQILLEKRIESKPFWQWSLLHEICDITS